MSAWTGATAPHLPNITRLLTRLVWLAWIVIAVVLLDALADLLMDAWLLDHLGFSSIFWTNFETGAVLFAVGVASALFVVGPVFAAKPPPAVRRIVTHVGLMVGVVSGFLLSHSYFDFLMAGGFDFGKVDPVFGNDVSFYVFDLVPYWIVWKFLAVGTLLGLTSWVVCSWASRDTATTVPGTTRFVAFVGHVGTLGTRVTLGILGAIVAVGVWLTRYDVLQADNSSSSIFSGAGYVDVEGLFSTINGVVFDAVLVLAATFVVILLVGRARECVTGGTTGDGDAGRASHRKLALALVAILLASLGFKGIVALRQTISVKPDEPVIQLPYIQAHIQATRDAFNLGAVERVTFRPNSVDDPLPDPATLLAHPSLKNAPLWPGFASYLEELVDLQHKDRILKSEGDPLVYGPLLDIFRQEQKLRAYYNFLDIDTTRYTIDGEPRMVVSSVREVPLVEPKPWLAWWGQQYMLFTHGLGMIVAHSGQTTDTGSPVFLAKGIPVASDIAQLQPAQQRVYYGEGAGSMAYTNVDRMQELDYPTDEGRATIVMAPDVSAGVPIDSFLKRLVFGYKSGQFFEILFSDLITDKTRVHYFRMPVERLKRIIPFLYVDDDPYAVAADDKLMWMVNAITWSDDYPYSAKEALGDKSDSRSPISRPHQPANYARDAVKATIDAHTGQVTFYKFADEPIVDTLSVIYPDLFTDAPMPTAIREQLQYPAQLLHIQFDDLYILYQMDDVMTFFNMEDMWDDSDEVLGPMIDEGSAIRFSIEPFNIMIAADGTLFPKAQQTTQFVRALLFTPEGARNLRAMPLVYQDGADYGRLIALQVAKGHYVMGPEQADSAIDQEPSIAQQFSWWNRQGLEVIRGHTTALIVDNELIYVEPLFLRSEQNPLTQLKQVSVVFRGKARMAPTLAEALTAAINAHKN